MNTKKQSWCVIVSTLLAVFIMLGCSDDNAAPFPNEEDTESATLDSLELSCKRGEFQIYGYLYKPQDNKQGKLPTVILSHSHSLTHAAMQGYARSIAEKGFVTYCFDFCGGSSESKSDGSTDDMTLFSEIEDLTAVLNAIRQLSYVDTERIFLLGSSLGGAVSALVAEACAEQVRGLILFYPAFNIAEMVKQFSGLGSFPGLGFSTDTPFCKTLEDYEMFDHIGTFDKDVLIIHGSKDIIVPVSYSEQAVSLYPHATLQIIAGANHGFNSANLGSMGSILGGMGQYDDVVMPYVFDYLQQHLTANAN